MLTACDDEANVTGQAKGAADAGAVVERLQAAGLPIAEITVYTAETDPNNLLGRPGGYESKATFRDTRIERGTGVGGGGSVEVFKDDDGAIRRREQMERISQSSPVLGEYTYQRGSVVLRIARALTPDQAQAYEQALKDMPFE
jgi:hypothetical protein